MWVLRAIGIALLLALLLVAGLVYDAGWNDGRMIAGLFGRDRLVAQCLPAARTVLAGRGFTPVDLEMGDPVSIAVASGLLGRARLLSGPFTFSDGANGPRIDGRLVCRVKGQEVNVEVDVDGLPLRAA